MSKSYEWLERPVPKWKALQMPRISTQRLSVSSNTLRLTSGPSATAGRFIAHFSSCNSATIRFRTIKSQCHLQLSIYDSICHKGRTMAQQQNPYLRDWKAQLLLIQTEHLEQPRALQD